MMRIFTLTVLISITLLGCSKNEETKPINPEGQYLKNIYQESEIRLKEVTFSTRPNFQNLQYTSEKTKQIEVGTNNLSLTMDIYLPPNASSTKKQPLLVMIHGGGFSSGDKDAWKAEVYTYAQAGYICASLNYRLTKSGGNQSPQLRLFAVQCALEDIQNGIRYLKYNANTYFIDTNRIVVFGGSAGGVLSLLNATEYDSNIGINNFPGLSSKTNGSISTGSSLINSDPANQPGLIKFDSYDSPVLMFHAKEYDSGADGYTWTQNAIPTQQAINNSGNTCTLVPQPNMTHTVNLSLGGDYWQYLQPFMWDKLKLAEL
ncbi:alpha/beta hydrolase [Pedobacter jejuensis]|uniref:Alpha/beta hydrolase n=1 Tax=Pedobacter jejuensis TaxID=1268550 RepID=A0A3N0BXY0_9SPHI|nr:alpha/beta hydrolase [Pedobacter jejuensis]RNL54570.1 alpha/beta hydrolase [Pedobacter jejuensis]